MVEVQPSSSCQTEFVFTSFNPLTGFDERRGRGDRGNPNLDPAMDIKMNREFYMHNDVRPPYTYAALIRYVSGQGPPLEDVSLIAHFPPFFSPFAGDS